MKEQNIMELLKGAETYIARITNICGEVSVENNSPERLSIGLEIMTGPEKKASIQYSPDKAVELLKRHNLKTSDDLTGRLAVAIYQGYCCEARPVDLILIDKAVNADYTTHQTPTPHHPQP